MDGEFTREKEEIGIFCMYAQIPRLAYALELCIVHTLTSGRAVQLLIPVTLQKGL
jgi:hypothetical protein